MFRIASTACFVVSLSNYLFSQPCDLLPILEDGLYHSTVASSLLPPLDLIERESKRRSAIVDDNQLKALYLCLQSEALAELGRKEDALAASRTAMSLHPTSDRSTVTQARCLARMRQVTEAIGLCNAALSNNPDYVPALALRATLRSQGLGQHDLALEDANHAIEINSRDARSYFIRSLILHRLRRASDALKDIETHLHLSATGMIGNEHVVHTQKGIILADQHRYDEARRAFELGLSADKKFYHAAKGLWGCYNEMKRHTDALLAAQRMRDIDSNNLETVKASAISYFNTHRYDEAKVYFCKWSSLRLNDSLPVSMIAACEFATGQYANAVEHYDEALKISPDAYRIRLAKAIALSNCKDEDFRDPKLAMREVAIVLSRQDANRIDTEAFMLANVIQYSCGQRTAAIASINEKLNNDLNLSDDEITALRSLANSFARNEKTEFTIPSVVADSSNFGWK
ncbi:MAG: hypothetical protein KDB27_31480 [Planctomycetales bacterium]|nr:hypothetical protein [Planctomycetales bacterium]